MATVYCARDIRHKRNVAIKVLRPDLGAVLGVDRFLSEIQVTANLQHPNLLPLFDSGEAGGHLFYVMPFVDGESLRARLDRERQLPVEEAVRIAVAVGNALDYAHRHGVIHRDLKPENILLHEGQPLVADFGIALAVSNAAGGRITQTGLSLGTPHYMSPEQATGDRTIDARSDIYSLGAVTYEMLTGEPPHTGATSQAIIARVLTEKPRPMRATRPSIPLHVEAAVNHALEKLAPDRFDSVREFSEAITGVRAATWMTAAATAPADTAVVRRRMSVREIGAWSLAAVAVAIAGFSLTRNGTEMQASVPAEFELVLPDSFRVGGSGSGYPLALSRSGQAMVIVGNYGKGSSLYIRRLDERAFQELKGSEGARSPSFSPDGTEILFTVGTGELKRILVGGGTPRTVASAAAGNGQASWGDGGKVLYSNGGQLFLVSPDGGTPQLVATADSARGHAGYGWPTMLPGGRAALITIWKGRITLDSARIGVVTIPDGKVSELGTFHGTNPRYSHPGQILYSTSDRQLFSAGFSTNSLKLTGTPTLVAENVSIGPGGYGAFDVSSNGTLAVFDSPGDAGRTLVVVTRNGVETPLNLRPGFYQSPHVSPDGRQVALTVYTSSGGGGSAQSEPNPDIWRFDLQSSSLSRVTTDSASSRPGWIADGSRIAYIKRGDTVASARELFSTARPAVIARIRKPARGIWEIAPGPLHGYGLLRVDTVGSGLVNDLYYFHQDSAHEARPLMNEPYDESSPAISPNGQLIAYTTNKTGNSEIYVRRFFGDPTEIMVTSGGGDEPVWSRSGRELFYRSRGNMMSATITQSPRLEVIRRDSLFVDRYSQANPTTNYSVFPDDKRFLMLAPLSAVSSRSPPILVRVNWRARYASQERK